ncbi:MAG TPA: FtsQ-type POTRA domain-containing protein [Thermodesulfovibrionia bacterium]|nr:FtsQ-type POTRA domain-containing protein [Thermodesulfovibrionia bacterium]
MQLKNRGRKNKPRKKERAINYMKFMFWAMSAIMIVAIVFIGLYFLNQSLPLERVIVKGNHYFTKKQIVKIMGVRKGENLLAISLKKMSERLQSSPWIKSVFLRKILPSTIYVEIKEATPTAFLSDRQSLYLLDEDGVALNKMKGKMGLNLPILTGIHLDKDKKKIREAIELIQVLKQKGIQLDTNVRISATARYGLVMDMNGEIIRFGYGQYKDKVERLLIVMSDLKKKMRKWFTSIYDLQIRLL